MSPVADACSFSVVGEPTIGTAIAERNPDGSSSHGSVNIGNLSGDFRLVVILVEFTDIKHETSRDELHNLVFVQMNKYWREVSYDQFNVIGNTVGWINTGHDEAYYGKDTDPKLPGSDQKGRELIADACRLANGVDFKQYQDIMVIFAGHSQASDSNNTSLIWPHGFWTGLNVTCEDKRFDSGGYASEIELGRGLNLGGFTHEFGHTIQLPDLYNTDPDAPSYWKTGIDYAGFWSLMACGSWGGPNNDSSSPIGLESWSRIKLGWLSSISVALNSDAIAQPLNQLGDMTGPRAFKIPATVDIYYLFEAREKVGVDKFLPDSGVLITRIDESKESGNGIVEVMDCHPETNSTNDATCKVNESWSDPPINIYMKVVGRQGTSYVIAFASKPITTIKNVYTAELSLSGLPSSALANVTVDGTKYTISGADRRTFDFLVGSTHTISVDRYIFGPEGTRYYCSSNSWSVSFSDKRSFVFMKQYKLDLSSPYGVVNGSSHYDEGSTATFSVNPTEQPMPGILGLLGGKYVFDRWSSGHTTPAVKIRMESSQNVTAIWKEDLTFPLLIVVLGLFAVIIIGVCVIMKQQNRRGYDRHY